MTLYDRLLEVLLSELEVLPYSEGERRHELEHRIRQLQKMYKV